MFSRRWDDFGASVVRPQKHQTRYFIATPRIMYYYLFGKESFYMMENKS